MAVISLTATNGAIAATHVTGDIKANTTWNLSGSPYLLDKGVKVISGVTLTVQPGVVIEFNATQTLTFTIEGTLKSVGTESSPIKVTSSQAASGEGAPGQYKGITVTGSGTGEFVYTEFEYGAYGTGGYYAYGELSTLNSATLKVERSIFRHNAYAGMKLGGTGSVEVSHSTFTENGDGIAQAANVPGPLSVRHSYLVNNTADGLYFNFLKESEFEGAVIENNSITGNAHAGINIRSYCASPVPDFPHGHGNDIYENGSTPETPADGSEIYSLYTCEALNVDWTGNYWGKVVFIHGPNPLLLRGFVCEGWPKNWYEGASYQPSYLAYSVYEREAWDPPPGPISTASMSTTIPIVCKDKMVQAYYVAAIHNSFYLAPGEISTEPILIE
jgi:hypothetical protein